MKIDFIIYIETGSSMVVVLKKNIMRVNRIKMIFLREKFLMIMRIMWLVEHIPMLRGLIL
jgi:hypothetical protein